MTNIHPTNKDYYSVLGVLPSAEAVVIGAAYRELAKKYHPDKWRGDRSVSDTRMRELNEAYELLSNEQRRREYDRGRNKTPDYNFANDFAGSPYPDAGKRRPSAKFATRLEEIKKGVVAVMRELNEAYDAGIIIARLRTAFRLLCLGLAATLLTLWGIGSVIYAVLDVQHLIVQGFVGLVMLAVAAWFWLRWWRA